MDLISGAWFFILFIHFRYAHIRYYLYTVCSPAGEAGKNAETGFMRWPPVCPYRKQWVPKDKISTYIVKVIFSKVGAFKRTIRKF
jgi:hypothetical protein